MAGRPKTRAKREAERRARGTQHTRPPHDAHVAALYAEKYTTFDALRMAMVQNGIVDHGINPYDCIQRAIDDTATDYILVRQKIDRDTQGNPDKLESHPLYEFMEHIREAMVRYSTFAMQYDISKRQLQLGESRVALLAVTLRTVLQGLGIDQDTIRQVPRLLIDQLQLEATKNEQNGHLVNTRRTRMDPDKAEALAEILANDTQVEIIEAEVVDNGHP